MINRRFLNFFKFYNNIAIQNVIKNNISAGYCTNIRSQKEFTVDIYNDVLKGYIDNKKKFDICSFIREMAPVTPNLHTFELINIAFGEPFSVVEKLTQELTCDQDTVTLKIAIEVAIRCRGSSLAFELFGRMKRRGIKLKQSYFWPILASRSDEHKINIYKNEDIMHTLSTMVALGVAPDHQTMVEYVLPNVDVRLPKVLLKNFLDAGLTVPAVLTPMLVFLLNKGRMTRAAADVCKSFEGSVDSMLILNPLLRDYLVGGDLNSTVHLLKVLTSRALDQNIDWLGRFLCLFVHLENFTTFIGEFRSLIQVLRHRTQEFRISNEAAIHCLSKMPDRYKEKTGGVLELLMSIMDTKYSEDIYMFVQQMPYPDQLDKIYLRDRMNIMKGSKSKTKTDLNKLLEHAIKEENLDHVEEIIAKCRSSKVSITPTVRADLFYMYVKLDELKKADQVEAKLAKSAPNFKLDQYMVVEYATRMVYKNEISKAINYLKRHSNNKCFNRNSQISGSCSKLLDAVANTGSPAHVQRTFELLTTSYRTAITKTMLGSLIKVHLRNNDVVCAIEQFVDIAEKYKKIPQMKSLLCAVLASAGDTWSEETSRMVETIAAAAVDVDGQENVLSTIIAALAEVGQTMRLKRMFEDSVMKFDHRTLLWYCKYFVEAKKVYALQNIVECANKTPLLDVESIYKMILDFYRSDDDCDGALVAWKRMRAAGVTPSQQFVRSLCDMCDAHQRVPPPDLALLLRRGPGVV